MNILIVYASYFPTVYIYFNRKACKGGGLKLRHLLFHLNIQIIYSGLLITAS